jgi:hypothetical protein
MRTRPRRVLLFVVMVVSGLVVLYLLSDPFTGRGREVGRAPTQGLECSPQKKDLKVLRPQGSQLSRRHLPSEACTHNVLL